MLTWKFVWKDFVRVIRVNFFRAMNFSLHESYTNICLVTAIPPIGATLVSSCLSERLTGIFWGKVSSCHVFNRAEIRNFQKLKEDADLVEMTWICFMCLKWGCSVHAPWTWFLSDCLDSNPVCFQPQRLVGSPEWSKRRVPVLSWKPHVVGFIQSQEDIWWGGGSGGCRIATAPYRPKDGSVRRWAGPPTSPPEPSPRTYIWT